MTFAFTSNFQQEYSDSAESLPLGVHISLQEYHDFVPCTQEVTFPQLFLSFFLFFYPRKVTLHLLLRDICLWTGLEFHEHVRVCAAVQLPGGSAFLGFLDAGELQTAQFPSDAYLHNPFLRMSCPLTSKQHHFRCQAACFKVWSATAALNNSICDSASLPFP